jgi:nitrogen fixation protein NifB
MKHCRQCRADAVGLLGEDQGQKFGLDALPTETPQVDHEQRRAYRAIVERERTDRRQEAADASQAIRRFAPASPLLIAVATKGGGRVNQHFGHAAEFQIFEVSESGCRFVGHRRVDRYCRGGEGEDDVLDATLTALNGVSVVLVGKIGRCPRQRLADVGIAAVDDYAFDYVETAIGKYLAARAAEEDEFARRA